MQTYIPSSRSALRSLAGEKNNRIIVKKRDRRGKRREHTEDTHDREAEGEGTLRNGRGDVEVRVDPKSADFVAEKPTSRGDSGKPQIEPIEDGRKA
jgi:hypothetical protein